MKKLWIIYLFFVAFLLTGCGQMTKVEKELSKERGNGILLTKNQLNKREKKEGPIEEVKYAKTSFQQEKKESLLALFDQMRSLGFEGDADNSEEDNDEKETLTDAEYHKRDQELLEHPESYGVCESDLDESIITYSYSTEGKTIQEAIANCQKTLEKLKAYGVEGADHLLDGLSTKEDDYVRVTDSGLIFYITTSLADITNRTDGYNDVLSINVSLPLSSLYVPQKYKDIIEKTNGKRYKVTGCSLGSPVERITMESGDYWHGDDQDAFSQIMLNMKDGKLIQVDMELPGNFASTSKVKMSDDMKETIRNSLLLLQGQETDVDALIRKMETKLQNNGTQGTLEWTIGTGGFRNNVLSVYLKD